MDCREEPDREVGLEEVASISGILQFRQSLQYLESTFFFSIAWGDVGTREKMIMSSQNVYRRLMCRLPRRALLSFDVLALCCVQENSALDIEKMKKLIKLMRPDRDGKTFFFLVIRITVSCMLRMTVCGTKPCTIFSARRQTYHDRLCEKRRHGLQGIQTVARFREEQ